MSEYIVTVPKRHFHQMKLNISIYNPSFIKIKPILGLCMPKNAHVHMNNSISSVSDLNKTK